MRSWKRAKRVTAEWRGGSEKEKEEREPSCFHVTCGVAERGIAAGASPGRCDHGVPLGVPRSTTGRRAQRLRADCVAAAWPNFSLLSRLEGLETAGTAGLAAEPMRFPFLPRPIGQGAEKNGQAGTGNLETLCAPWTPVPRDGNTEKNPLF